MALDRRSIEAIVFDYGNTLIEFGAAELQAYGHSLAAALEEHYGPVDMKRFFALRERSRMEPYAGDPPSYQENDMTRITQRLVRELYGKEATPSELRALLQARFDSFVSVVRIADEVKAMLERLAQRFPLALLSNYPDGPAIRASMENTGIAHLFTSVVVSGDLGYVKPHPITFASVLADLDLAATSLLFVGDNWLADVQGAKRVGMQMVRSRQWIPPEHFEVQPQDHAPDAEIQNILELESLLGSN